MTHIRRALVVAVAFASFACRYQPTPVQLQGGPADIAAVAGTWDGQYSGVESGRSGDISFVVQAGKDTAFGDVMMHVTAGQPVRAVDVESGMHAMHVSSPELLRVTFVRITGGYVQGSLEPYVAPDCKCVVTTVFRGTIKGNRIEGDYVTRGERGLRQTGAWSVTRR